MKFIKDNIFYLVVLLIGICVYFIIAFSNVSGDSMYPTLNDGDFLLMQCITKPSHGDIVAIYSEEAEKVLCKRIIGVAGDEIKISKSGVYRNDKLLDEPYINKPTWSCEENEIIVQEGYVYVLGDNRHISLDSEELGCLKEDDIEGIMIINLTSSLGLTSISFRVLIFVIIAIITILPIPKNKDGKSSEA